MAERVFNVLAPKIDPAAIEPSPVPPLPTGKAVPVRLNDPTEIVLAPKLKVVVSPLYWIIPGVPEVLNFSLYIDWFCSPIVNIL